MCCVLGGLQRRISVYADCTPDEPARVVKPHRKHAQNTTGEVRGEFQRRRVCACCRSRNTHGACAAAGRFCPRLLPSLVETTITVDSHGRNQAACRIRGFVREAYHELPQMTKAVGSEVRACCETRRWSSDRRPSRVLSPKLATSPLKPCNGIGKTEKTR